MRGSASIGESGQRDLFDDGVDDAVGGYAFSLGLVGQHQAMAQYIIDDGPDVLRVNVVSSPQPGMGAPALWLISLCLFSDLT